MKISGGYSGFIAFLLIIRKHFGTQMIKLNGDDVFMNKFLLRPLSDLMTDDLKRVYKIFVGLSKDE